MLNGIKMEKYIIQEHALRKSSKHEDANLDIDAWDGDTSVSIKTQHTALKTGNLALEFALVDSDGKSIDSWLCNGKAEEYWFVVGETIHVYNAKKLKAWVTRNELKLKITGLTNQRLVAENRDQKRKYLQSRCFLVNMRRIKHLLERELFV